MLVIMFTQVSSCMSSVKEGWVLSQAIQLSLAPLQPTIGDRATWNRTWWSTYVPRYGTISKPILWHVRHACYEPWEKPHGDIRGTISFLSCFDNTSQRKDLTNVSCHKILHIVEFSPYDHVVLALSWISTDSQCEWYCYYSITLSHVIYFLISGRASHDQKVLFKQRAFARTCCIDLDSNPKNDTS